MKRVLTIILLTTGMISLAWAQLTPNQKELLEKYKSTYNKSRSPEIESYSSPEIYDEETDTSEITEEEYTRYKDYRDSKRKYLEPREFPPPDSMMQFEKYHDEEFEQLELFGHDIFEIDEDAFRPDIHNMPPDGYQFGPGDNILVNIWGRVDLEMTLTVDREGKVFIPKVGEVVAAGSTLDQFKDRLNDKLSKIYSDYNLSATYGKLRQMTIYVFGEVKKPGGYTVSSLANLLNALYIAGGINDRGSLRKIQVVRNTKIKGTYDLYDLILKGDNSYDIKLYSGDVVYVPIVGPLVAIQGEVRRPAIYELSGEETISQAIKLAGGATPEAFMQSLSLDRVGTSDSRILMDINLADSALYEQNNIELQDGDKLTVYSIYDFHENLVYLTGYVKHPGLFGISDSMRVSDIIDNGGQLKENAYTKRADLFRTNEDDTKTLISIALEEILNGNSDKDVLLMPLDSLVIYSYDHVTRDKFVYIDGEIKLPGQYSLYNDMHLTDLLFLAGNLTKQAYMVYCEIARINSYYQTEIIQVNLEDMFLRGNFSSDIALMEDDHVFIRQVPDWRPVQMVTIEGEVMFPGKYAIRHKDERISEMLARAGGLTPTAFPEGAIYVRKTIEAQVEQRNIGQIIYNTQEYRLDSLGNMTSDYQIKYKPELLNRVIIDLPEVLRNPNCVEDIAVADSDYIYIPTYPSGVQVIGAVAFNGTISYIKNKKAKYYINQAGGLTPDGDNSGVRLVKPNGKVYYGKKAKGQRVELGDALVVPSKIKRKTDWSKIFSTTATIISSMATTILVVDALK